MGEAFIVRRGGGNPLNFRVIGSTAQPASPRENDIWVDTDTKIPSWFIGTNELVYELSINPEDAHQILAPHKLTAGDVLNFVIQYSCGTFDWIRIVDNGHLYPIRYADGTPVTSWEAGTKVSVLISNDTCVMGGIAYPTAKLLAYGSYSYPEGTVWIETALESAVQFNALKKNALFVYPNSVKQYIGEWESMNAYIFQSGEWVQFSTPWDGTIYRNGTEETVTTGGLTQKSNVVMMNGYSNDSKIEKKSDRIVLGPAGNGGALLTTVNKVDLTKYNTLTIKGSGYGHAGVHDFESGSIRDDGTVYSTVNSNANLDISQLTGLYYITFGAYNTDNTYTCYEVYVS